MARASITSFYPKVEFLDAQYLGDGPYNTHYRECDYCGDYKKIYVRNNPVYYYRDAKRKLVSYCRGCYDAVLEGGQIMIADDTYCGYYEILDAIKNSGKSGVAISFEDAVMAAFNRTENISYNVSGAEPGVSMLKRYLGCYRIADNIISFDDKRLWEFRYKLQHEEPRVKVVKSSEVDDTLLLSWNKDYVEDH